MCAFSYCRRIPPDLVDRPLIPCEFKANLVYLSSRTTRSLHRETLPQENESLNRDLKIIFNVPRVGRGGGGGQQSFNPSYPHIYKLCLRGSESYVEVGSKTPFLLLSFLSKTTAFSRLVGFCAIPLVQKQKGTSK